MNFFLGTHQPTWLRYEAFAGVNLFISRRRLAKYTELPPAGTSFALDSGGFTELQLHGRWVQSPEDFAYDTRRYIRFYGSKLLWAAPQDWMCEPLVLAGGKAARGVVFHGTGLTVEEHQRRTVKNFVVLRKLLGERVIPVLQGWKVTDYWRCQEMYKAAGIRLEDERTVGVGTVCRRQSTAEATSIMTTDSPRFALYLILGDLEDRCLVKSEERPGGRERGGYPGRYYHITPKGMRETKGLP